MYKIFRPNKAAAIAAALALTMLLSLILSTAARAEKTAAEPDTVSLPIFMYHSILKDKSRHGKYVISPEDFEADLKYLSENGYTTVVMQDVIDYVNKGTPLPEKPVMLTFDDGYYNNYTYAYPLLEKYDARIVISVVGAYADLYTKTPDVNPYYAHLDWGTIEQMHLSGRVEFQNHSYDLHRNTAKRSGAKKARGESDADYRTFLQNDLMHLQNEFMSICSYMPSTFTYPFGAVSDASVEITKELGFSASLSCEQKMNFITPGDRDCLYRMNRFIRTHSKSVEDTMG